MAWDPRVGPALPASPDPAPAVSSPVPRPARPWHAQPVYVRMESSSDPDAQHVPGQDAPIPAQMSPGNNEAVDAIAPPILTPGRPLEPMHGDFGPSAEAPPWTASSDVTLIPAKRAAPNWGETSLGMTASTAAGVSYLGWWLTGLLIYFNERHNWYVRFHALQSVLFTGALTIVSVAGFVTSSLLMDLFLATHQAVFRTLSQGTAAAILLAVLCAWLTPLIAAWSGYRLRIPFLAPYAERYATLFPPETMPSKP